ncbi:MAG: TRAP transporter substrate-binding protein [Planctomycetes bacterium]|nr:TRAP transporter substrate-binding protein [Planctomycetota bacterium]
MRCAATVVWAACLAAALAPAGCDRGAAEGGKRILKVASVLPAEHPSSKALMFFRDRVAELSGGRMEVQLFLNSQLGDNIDTLDSCRGGNIEMIFTSVSPLAQYNQQLHAMSMPFIFRDAAHQHAVLDGPVGREVAAEIEKAGFKTLAFFDAGFRSVMTKRGPVRAPADLRGMKVRVMASPVMIDTLNALGASAVALNQGEVYSALQTGVLDGWENNLSTTLSFRMYETGCRHMAWTRHLAIPDLLLVNKACYEGMPEADRRILEQGGAETHAKQRVLWAEDEVAALETLKAAGMTFTDVDAAAFQDRAAAVYDTYYRKYGPAFQRLCEAVKAVP